MKTNRSKFPILCLAGGLFLTQLTGCQSTATAPESNTTEAAQESSLDENIKAITDISITAELGEETKKTITYLAEDLDSTWSKQTASNICLSEDGITIDGSEDNIRIEENTVILSAGGTYALSGSLSDGQIRIEAEREELVRLVLNGVSLTSSSSAPIYAPNGAKVILILANETENKLSDAELYQFESEEEDEPNAAIFTKGDLSINGTGSLEVTGNYECGIRSKGNLKALSGTLTITAKKDGLKGKDSVIIRDGNYQITSGKDGIKSNNDEDADKGYIWIDGGSIQIAAEDDGIQAESALILYGGSIDITKCEEGLEGKTVDILDGTIHITASDDAINSAGPAETEWEKMQDQDGVYTRITGGTLYLNAQADGIDSNGDLYLEGGTVYLSGPDKGGNGILDYNGNASITGGTILAAGTSSMLQYFGEDSTQNFLVIHYPELQPADTLIQLLDADGQILAEYAPEKDFEAAIISSPALTTDSSCQVKTGDNAIDFIVSDGLNTHGDVSKEHGRMPFPGKHDGFRGDRPEGMEPPDGKTPPEGRKRPDGVHSKKEQS